MPAIEKGRYFSLQFIDQYTFNFAYVGSRATGNAGGTFLLAGPRWKGAKPDGITSLIQSETDFVFVLFRTQLFDPADIDKVKAIQAGYKVQTLSAFLGQPAPSAAPLNFRRPISAEEEKTSLAFFNLLNFVLQFCPTHPSEVELMARFAKIGIGAGQPFAGQALSAGDADGDRRTAWPTPGRRSRNSRKRSSTPARGRSGDGFGTRAHLDGQLHLSHGGSGARHLRQLEGRGDVPRLLRRCRRPANSTPRPTATRFAFLQDQLPPVNAFWSLTLYELPASLLSANPLNRYLINSPMLPTLKHDADGGVTLLRATRIARQGQRVQLASRAEGPFFMVLRLYWPKPEALDGRWTAHR